MRQVIIHIVLLSVLSFPAQEPSAQESSAQESYVNSTPEKHSFNNKKWSGLKDLVINESGGAFGSENRVAEGSYYNYEKEDTQDFYEENQAYSKGSGAGSESEEGANYHPKEKNLEHPQQRYTPKGKQFQRTSKKTNSSSVAWGMGPFQYILFGLLTVMLAFLIYQLFMKTSFNNKGAKVIDHLEEVAPTQIPKSELELLLEKALANDDFRGAIRLYFIFILKDLSEKEWIWWEKKKTNFSYLMEMRSRPQYDSFNEAVSIYELVWYGNYSVGKEDFNSLEPLFKNLLNSLNSEGK